MRKSPWLFLLFVFALSIPFWLIGAFVEPYLPKDRPINLPFSSLMAFSPVIVALFLVYRENGKTGAWELLRRSFDYRRIKGAIWYLAAFLIMPAVIGLGYVWMRLSGAALPEPQLNVLMVPAFFVMFFVAAVGEELGWTGYALEPLQERWGALAAALILGMVWATWHIVPFAQLHHGAAWIFWQCVATVAARVLIVWLYFNAGRSVFAAIVFHTMLNVSEFSFPNNGSHFDPFYAAVILGIAAATVTLLSGAQSLARPKRASREA
jgi:membrane protease YdiL (CAAX protease family)